MLPASPTGNVIVTATLAGGATTTAATIPASQAIVTGGTTTPVTLGDVGSYTLTATYAGDSNYGPSTGSIGVTTTLPPTSITFVGPTNTTVGTPTTVIALLRYTATDGLTGLMGHTVTLTSSSATTVGPSVTVNADTAATVVGASASFTFASAGTYTITASYPGDNKNGPATVTPFTLIVSAPSSNTPSFTMTLDDPTVADANPVNVTNQTQPTGTTVTIKAFGGFSTLLNLSYDRGTISNRISIGFRDASGKLITAITPSSSGTQVTVVVSPVMLASNSRPLPPGTKVPIALAGALMSMLVLKRRKLSARAHRILRVINAALVVLVACTTLGAYSSTCLGNCNEDLNGFLTVTAAPANTSQVSTPQSVLIKVEYIKELGN